MTQKYPKQKWVLTSAQACASPHKHFLEGLDSYCKEEKANLIILPMIGNSAEQDLNMVHDLFYDNYQVESGTPKLNNNIQIEQFCIRPYQIDPLTGLNRFAQRGTSLIFASPKQRMKTIAHSNHKHPKYLLTTGACTKPNYATGEDVSAERRRLGNIAKRDHIYGALIVEVESDETFHMRNIRADTTGKFVDLGLKYDGDKCSTAILEALVLGDYHNGRTDPEVRQTNFEMIETYEPKRIILHDFFDGHSVSHHMEKKYIEQKILQQKDYGHHVLETELQEAYDELWKLREISEDSQIVIVASNHHYFLSRYLNEGRFMKDPTNARFGFKLASYMAEKDYNDPVEGGIRMIGRLPKRVKFLRLDEDYKVRGYQLSCHGDKGAGGGRGSMVSKENDMGKSISGHCHAANILRDTYTVGTSLPLNMFYMRGYPSNWSHSNCFLWDTGTVQTVNIIDGKWTT